jgi:hypothetical protein
MKNLRFMSSFVKLLSVIISRYITHVVKGAT